MIGKSLQKAATYLREGRLVAIPTETVYGLAGNAYEPQAVAQIFQAKKRPHSSPLIVHTDTLAKADAFVAEWPDKALKLAQACWPGPLTLLLPKKNRISNLVTAGLSTVGVRIPQHPLTQQLLASLPFPLAAPSANPFGYISPTTAQHVQEQLGDQLAYILDGGACSVGIESTVVGFGNSKPVVYRLGGIPLEALTNLIGPVDLQQTAQITCAPGMLSSHYAPRTPLVVGELSALLRQYQGEKIAILAFDQLLSGVDPRYQVVLSATGSLAAAAQHLFSALHKLDQLGADRILAAYAPEKGLGKTINDRLKRAGKQDQAT